MRIHYLRDLSHTFADCLPIMDSEAGFKAVPRPETPTKLERYDDETRDSVVNSVRGVIGSGR